MSSRVLVGSASFIEQLSLKASQANDHLYIQAMTFEGDSAGEKLIDILIKSKAQDRRLLIDSFSKMVVSDRFVWSLNYIKDSSFRAEVRNGAVLIEKAKNNGIEIRFTNPVGFMMHNYPLRNHKKMMIADSTAFIGGINFSDHNFSWHDMMVEMDDPNVSTLLTDDFLKTWNGENQSGVCSLKSGALYFLNGIKSKSQYNELFNHLLTAKRSIQVISPYVSEPLMGILRVASQKGVEISIYSPEANNKSIFKNFMLHEWRKGYFKLFISPGMSHLKAIVIDDSKLIFGSSNFDVVSYHFEQEVVMVTDETDLVNEFRIKVLSDLVKNTFEFNSQNIDRNMGFLKMKALNSFCKLASRTILKPHD